MSYYSIDSKTKRNGKRNRAIIRQKICKYLKPLKWINNVLKYTISQSIRMSFCHTLIIITTHRQKNIFKMKNILFAEQSWILNHGAAADTSIGEPILKVSNHIAIFRKILKRVSRFFSGLIFYHKNIMKTVISRFFT